MAEMYVNVGDVNFFDTGKLVKRTDENNLEFSVITCDCDPNEENNYIVSVGNVDLSDIPSKELQSICKESDIPLPNWGNLDYYTETNLLEQLADSAFEQGHSWNKETHQFSRNKVIDFMEARYIDEIPWEYWEPNFMERNCVVEFHNDYGQSEKRIYNSIEDASEDFADRAEKGWSLTVIDK